MPYYPTLEEDLARAKAILAKGQPSTWEKAQFTPEVVEALRQVGGGTISGGDVYAAYKLLESFVAAIEALQEDRDFWHRKAGEEHVLVEAVGRKVCELALRQQQKVDQG